MSPVDSTKLDGLEKIQGRAQFTDDLTRPGMLHGAFHRSPHAHARIVRIDTTAALAMEGVKAVLVGPDLPVAYGVLPVAQDEHALALDTVRFVGEEVAAVAATTREAALAAAQAIVVDYETLPAVFSVEAALADDAPIIHNERRKKTNILRKVRREYGDVDEGLNDSDVVLEDSYYYPGSTHVPLETHTSLAEPDGHGRVVLHTSTQIPHHLHIALARVLQTRLQNIRVIKPHVGAGYGGKSDPFATEICAAALALRTGRPVKFILDREEVFYAHRGRHPAHMRIKLGAKSDGTLTTCDFSAQSPGGAYASYGVVTAYYFGVFLPLPYRLENLRFETSRLYTNHPPCGPKRGHGAIQPRFALEVQVDRLAEALGQRPDTFRLANLAPPMSETCNGLRITSSAMGTCIEKATQASGFAAKHNHLPHGHGVGLATSAYMCGAAHPIHDNALPQSSVSVTADRSGRIAIFSGTADIGQGSNHMLAALVSQALGIALRDCTVLEADTDLTPVDLGAYSSRVTFMAGNAALEASNKLRDVLLEAASAKLDLPGEELIFQDGRIASAADPQRSLAFSDAIKLAEQTHGTLAFTGSYSPPRIGSRFKRESVGPSPAYSFTAQVAEVEVDTQTGFVHVKRIWCAHDCGKAIHPGIVEGQIEGSVYMGVGEALMEEQSFHPSGLHRSPSLLEYKVPTIHETPEIISILVEEGDLEGPLGAKEVGEGPQLPTVPAIANAIYDACGIRLTEAPFTPERVLKALEKLAKTG
mgnify:CR=1 FL=1